MDVHVYTNPSTPMSINHFNPQYKINPSNPFTIKTHQNPPKQIHFINPPKITVYIHPICSPTNKVNMPSLSTYTSRTNLSPKDSSFLALYLTSYLHFHKKLRPLCSISLHIPICFFLVVIE
jgi:hypothetical protein